MVTATSAAVTPAPASCKRPAPTWSTSPPHHPGPSAHLTACPSTRTSASQPPDPHLARQDQQYSRCSVHRRRGGAGRSFRLSFHLTPYGPSGGHRLDDPPQPELQGQHPAARMDAAL